MLQIINFIQILIYMQNRQNIRGSQTSSQQQQSQQIQIDHPQIIKNYIIGKTIGEGTFNKVKIGRHLLTNQKVAIKMISKQSIQNQADKERLNNQLKILRKVRHPNIIQLYQILESKKYIFLVTEYASRGQLFQHIVGQQKLTQFEACKFLQQLLDAIQYIHSLGVVHRDLKPQNLLLDYKFNIKLIDFGLSSIYSQGQKLKTACGSPCYASPQMIKGQPYEGLKTDIWSIGIILYAMCFGYLPFDNPNTSDLYKQITQGKYEIPQHASKQLKQLLLLILEVDPTKRANINQIRYHPFCKFSPIGLIPGIIVGLSDIPYEQQIQREMIQQVSVKFSNGNNNNCNNQLNAKQLKQWIKFNKHNDETTTYYLILQRNLRIRNETVVNYYVRKNNIINRYAIAQKVKANYQKRLKERLQLQLHERHVKEQKLIEVKNLQRYKKMQRQRKSSSKYKRQEGLQNSRKKNINSLDSKKHNNQKNLKAGQFLLNQNSFQKHASNQKSGMKQTYKKGDEISNEKNRNKTSQKKKKKQNRHLSQTKYTNNKISHNKKLKSMVNSKNNIKKLFQN